MRKHIISSLEQDHRSAGPWLDLGQLAQVEITSEDVAHPIESALIPFVGQAFQPDGTSSCQAGKPDLPGAGNGWRASQPGKQMIRLSFDEPQRIARIRLVFREAEQQRTQEFVLRWSADRGQTYREIVRQQYGFSPPTTVEEVEDYQVELSGVTGLEIAIIPEISGGDTRASLAELRLA
jgi:hypothetical protein